VAIRNRRFVIVGDGAAGITAARTLREADGQAEITLVSDDPNPAYYRAALTNYLLGELREEQIWATRPQFYDQYRLTRLYTHCSGLDPQRRLVYLQAGPALSYDAVLLACGARSRRPEFSGAELNGVMTLRTLQDCRFTMERMASGNVKNAIVVGGGPLALEWALGLHARGVSVSILLRGATFMAGALDKVASDLLAARLRQAGIQILINDEITSAQAGADGSVSRVVTKSGQTLSCQLVAAAIGVMPNTEWLQSSGLALSKRRGVAINRFMASSLEGVYAAGDVADFDGQMLQLWEPAQAQARVAALNMLGTPTQYAPGVHYMATRLFDLDFASLGQIQDVQGASEIVQLPKGTGRIDYKKLVISGGRLVGALMLGHREDRVRNRGRAFKRLIDAGLDVSAIAHQLLDSQFDVAGWLEQSSIGNRALLAAPSATRASGAQRTSIANDAAMRGTSVLSLTGLGALMSGAAVSGSAGSSGTSSASSSRPPSSTAALAAPANVGNPFAPDNQGAAHALGTRMLQQFNLRPNAPALVATARQAFLGIAGHPRALQGDLVRIGRDPSSEIALNDPGVGLIHAHLQRAGEDWYLRDLGSHGGTWVNDNPQAAPNKLQSGDRIRVGQSELTFWFAGEEALAQARATSVAAGPPAPRLQVQSGHAVGLIWVLAQSPSSIGSDMRCTFWVHDPGLALQHARVDRSANGWTLTCVYPQPSLWVNGHGVAPNTPVPLSEGLQLQLGSLQLRYTETALPAHLQSTSPSVTGASDSSRAASSGQRMQAFAAVPPSGGQPANPSQPVAHQAQAVPHQAQAVPRPSQPIPRPSQPTPHPPSTGAGARLRAERGPNAGQMCALSTYLLLGQDPRCNWVIADAGVAPRHVEIQRFDNGWFVRSVAGPVGASGATGVYRNGMDIGAQGSPLTLGDRLQFGSTTVLVFEANP
jgi:NADPH-dependent 2,4-dienoyl-CoA reductase/sulfur reductase-like enzyme/pSer/pThr/pTyr-binding forkhead associated (FHA) protein